ncbi:hypothetical protein BABINDRAFT_83079 [Babjeviella inositovora NRRL Y-12698]|uniref:Uncharacterized protein n=1 Tax=Babjeviella inositovora NRRL Y-12698 TaxID=984486 RepID=A0A1E3QKZ4_9ASCO|nr:uncharacterized protein BABINDRAFT_83079 [Babjeviella inositovora NRRL Y-12698]ODQ78366.1 hypothetical protein BABINDRAFT_83079 [Babjeviella inositovora NRRL Y-12698]
MGALPLNWSCLAKKLFSRYVNQYPGRLNSGEIIDTFTIKFIVDDVWVTHPDEEIEYDEKGIPNNVIIPEVYPQSPLETALDLDLLLEVGIPDLSLEGFSLGPQELAGDDKTEEQIPEIHRTKTVNTTVSVSQMANSEIDLANAEESFSNCGSSVEVFNSESTSQFESESETHESAFSLVSCPNITISCRSEPQGLVEDYVDLPQRFRVEHLYPDSLEQSIQMTLQDGEHGSVSTRRTSRDDLAIGNGSAGGDNVSASSTTKSRSFKKRASLTLMHKVKTFFA